MIRILLSTRLGERRMTQAELARKTDIRPTTINDLYHEMADRVSLEQLDAICEVLDIDLDEQLDRLDVDAATLDEIEELHNRK